MLKDPKIRFALAACVVIYVVFRLFGEVLPPFLAGLVLAYMLDPLARLLARIGVGRDRAAAIVVGGSGLAAVASMAVIVPFVLYQARDLLVALPGAKTRAIALAQPWWNHVKPLLGKDIVSRIQDAAAASAGEAMQTAASVLGHAVEGGYAAVNCLSFALLAVLTAYYLMRDRERLGLWIYGHVPLYARDAAGREFAAINSTLSAWLRGQAISCLILAGFYSFGLTLCGLRFGLLIGLATGLFAFVPFVGFLGGLAAGAVACAMTFDSWQGWAVTAGVFMVGSFIEGYVLAPKLVGHSVGLNELWVMFAILAGGHLFGLPGVMFAVPGAAVLNVLCHSASRAYMASRYYRGDAAEA